MPRGHKQCKSCQAQVGPRTKKCPSCGYEFQIGKSQNKAKKLSATGRGRKTCSCGTIQGVRTKTCISCGKPFHFKPSFLKEKRIKVDWRELQRGEHFRVISGSGPYMMAKDNNGEPVKMNIGYRGIFRVHHVDSKGIHAYPVSKHESGHCYIYMGPKEKTDYGVIHRKHKIRKVKKKIKPHV